MIDSAGLLCQTASASASTVAAPNPSVSVARGNHEVTAIGNCTASYCYNALVTVSNFAANAIVNYSCSDNGGQFWPQSSGTTDVDWNGNIIRTNGSGSTQFNTMCVWGYWSNAGHTLTITANGTSGSYTG